MTEAAISCRDRLLPDGASAPRSGATGKESETDYLKELGASEVMLRQSLDLAKIKPLGKELWAGAVDNLGGDFHRQDVVQQFARARALFLNRDGIAPHLVGRKL